MSQGPIDFTKQSSVAPPAPGQLPGNMLPVGKPMLLKKPLPEEEEVLRKLGWEPGDPVPGNMAEILGAQEIPAGSLESVVKQAHLEATDPSHMPPPAPLNTPALDFTEKDITELSAEDRNRANSVAASVLKAAKDSKLLDDEMPEEADPSIRDAIRMAATGPEMKDDTESDTYDAGMPKDLPNAVAELDTTPCARCGWPRHLTDPIEPTEDDKTTFVQCMLGQRQFEKSYELFGGQLRLRVRSIMPMEADIIWQQIAADYEKKRIRTAIDERDFGNRYRACLQLIGIEGLGQPVILPQSYDEWTASVGPSEDPDTPVRLIYEKLQKDLAVSESIHRTITNTVAEFNQLQVKMEANSQNADFWKATDAS